MSSETERTIRLSTVWAMWMPEQSLELTAVVDEWLADEFPTRIAEEMEKAQERVGQLGVVRRVDIEIPESAADVHVTDLSVLPAADMYVIAASDDGWWTIDGIDRLTLDEVEQALINAFEKAKQSVGDERVSVFPLTLDLDLVKQAFDPPLLVAAAA